MKIYSGAGILPITIINKNYYFITFKLLNNLLSDAGGKKENNDEVIKTACRELFEESAGLIKLDKNIIKNKSIHLDISYKDTYYRCYIIFIDNIDIKTYNDNIKKINKFKYNPFGETQKLKLINLSLVFNSKLDNHVIIDKKTNKKYILSTRLKNIFIELLKSTNIKKLKNLLQSNNIIELNKIKEDVKTYEYYTNNKIVIKNIVIYKN
jgi:hypothetical protein